jgi:hypothetical protein
MRLTLSCLFVGMCFLVHPTPDSNQNSCRSAPKARSYRLQENSCYKANVSSDLGMSRLVPYSPCLSGSLYIPGRRGSKGENKEGESWPFPTPSLPRPSFQHLHRAGHPSRPFDFVLVKQLLHSCAIGTACDRARQWETVAGHGQKYGVPSNKIGKIVCPPPKI